MKASELRIGNVTNKGLVKSFYESGIHTGYGMTFSFNEICPVPLEYGHFTIAGFNERNTKFRKLLKKNNVSIDVSHYGETVFAYCFGRRGVIGLDYVHQLQNLYFALTGEELTFEL